MTDNRTILNPVKEKLKRGEPIFVFNVFEMLHPAVVKVVAQTGYDMLMIDTEHAIHNEETLASFIVGARDNGLCPLVTVPTTDRLLVSPRLDAGALGISLCHSESPGQVEELVSWMKYPPVGERALAMGANAGYRDEDAAQYCREANDATLLMLKIESRSGVENAEALLANEHVDVVVFGPGDLAADMGFHGGWQHPEVLAAMESVVEIALARGVAVEPSVFPTDRTGYAGQRERGIQIFGPTRETEYQLLRKSAVEALQPYR